MWSQISARIDIEELSERRAQPLSAAVYRYRPDLANLATHGAFGGASVRPGKREAHTARSGRLSPKRFPKAKLPLRTSQKTSTLFPWSHCRKGWTAGRRDSSRAS